MRLAVISDVHGNDLALQAIANDFESQFIDEIVFLGDLLVGGPNPQNSMDILKSLEPAYWVNGNTDSKFIEIYEEYN